MLERLRSGPGAADFISWKATMGRERPHFWLAFPTSYYRIAGAGF